MRAFLGLLFGMALFSLMVAGCGPSLTEEELGTVILDVGQLPGADQPFELPESYATPASDLESEQAPESETEPAGHLH